MNATRRFAAWCDRRHIAQFADVQAVHVAALVKELQSEFTAPTVKQHLAALRMLFDWLVTGHVLDVNPAHAVRDYFVQGRRGWVRLHEKGGKEHEVPCHHNLEQRLDEYIAAAGIAGDADGPLFPTAAGKTNALTSNSMWQQDAYRMIQRRAADAGIKTRIRNGTFRATGITACLKNSGKLEVAHHITNHESARPSSTT